MQLDWQHLWEELPCLMAVVDADGKIVKVTRSLRQLWEEVATGSHFPQTWEKFQSFFLERTSGEVWITRKGEAYRFYQEQPASLEGGTLYRLEPYDQGTRGSQELDAIIENSYDCIYITDAHGITLHTNSAIERLTGIPKEYYIGKDVRYLERRGILKKSVTLEVLKTGQPVSVVQANKQGKLNVITGSPVFDEDGKVVRVVTNIRDVSELNRLKDELDETRKKSDRYRRELSQLRKLHLKDELSIIMNDLSMKQAVHLAERVAPTDTTVLLLGESGVGKEVFARTIHRQSPRFEDGSFITVNCGAIPPDLIESELFGYEPGAFTGAKKEGKPGIFEIAENGTIFLDEIGELPQPMQVKLLRVLQERSLRRVGGIRSVPFNARIIAATNRNLMDMVKKGEFREDLYYRISVVPIEIPPLRHRRNDIKPLLLHFLDHFNKKHRTSRYFLPEVYEKLRDYDWPGNVRELANLVERVVITSPTDAITTQMIPETHGFSKTMEEEREPGVRAEINGEPYFLSGEGSFPNLPAFSAQVEREVLAQAYRRHHSSYQVAKRLSISQSSAIRKAYKYGIKKKS
ncbi:MAG: sigma 54-interacting transcriptional regulator [Firmicutes bacterium]|uniref:HTH-type transcriptional regulatory protein TyrR n=1 Tax=Melghirimyces thermohalophilus TaxID=1236220 RepID=A0A1G6IRG6_9BACL|nr:sigma 54-interacting transcriptional regulator [Melghirimyces thermohalophilus]MDA8351600.1 sigma 54-interacting transcriptional regulator [Bacillota bacterium]SDC09023.1 PAS domain S-box-containing protein [Melghirimyces thermohalophilus]